MQDNNRKSSTLGRIVRISISLLMFSNLGACAAYKNKFDCPPSTGAYCASVEEIERMVNNGSIWKLNKATKPQRSAASCSGKKCQEAAEDTDIDNGYIGNHSQFSNSKIEKR